MFCSRFAAIHLNLAVCSNHTFILAFSYTGGAKIFMFRVKLKSSISLLYRSDSTYRLILKLFWDYYIYLIQQTQSRSTSIYSSKDAIFLETYAEKEID